MRLSPPTSGLARMGRRGGAGGRGVCFSTLLAANFEPGLDGAVEGCAALAWSLPVYLSLTENGKKNVSGRATENLDSLMI